MFSLLPQNIFIHKKSLSHQNKLVLFLFFKMKYYNFRYLNDKKEKKRRIIKNKNENGKFSINFDHVQNTEKKT